MTGLAELIGGWPPTDAPDAHGYRRTPLAGSRLLAATGVPSAPGWSDGGAPGPAELAVAIAAATSGDLLLARLARDAHGWRAARIGDGSSAAIVAALGSAVRLDDGFTLRCLIRPDVGGEERAITVDQTNASVVVGDSVIVKWITEPEAGGSRSTMLLDHLGHVGFTGVPLHHGTLTWEVPDGTSAVVASVGAYLSGARDGWEWCVDALGEHLGHALGPCPAGCAADFPSRLGALAAGLHIGLATPSAVFPQPVGRAGGDALGAWADAAGDVLSQALELTNGSEGAELAAWAGWLRDGLDELRGVTDTLVQPTHGDLHVGQVLSWTGGLAIIDFDGNPVRDAGTIGLQPAARDVAQLRCSLDHVGRIVDRNSDGAHRDRVEAWVAAARVAFLDAYRGALAAGGRAELFDERLLGPFELEQECRELVYAGRTLPRWRYAPMGALRSMMTR